VTRNRRLVVSRSAIVDGDAGRVRQGHIDASGENQSDFGSAQSHCGVGSRLNDKFVGEETYVIHHIPPMSFVKDQSESNEG
jgi:hypothetical protein